MRLAKLPPLNLFSNPDYIAPFHPATDLSRLRHPEVSPLPPGLHPVLSVPTLASRSPSDTRTDAITSESTSVPSCASDTRPYRFIRPHLRRKPSHCYNRPPFGDRPTAIQFNNRPRAAFSPLLDDHPLPVLRAPLGDRLTAFLCPLPEDRPQHQFYNRPRALYSTRKPTDCRLPVLCPQVAPLHRFRPSPPT